MIKVKMLYPYETITTAEKIISAARDVWDTEIQNGRKPEIERPYELQGAMDYLEDTGNATFPKNAIIY